MDAVLTKKVAVILCAWRIGNAPSCSAVPSSNPIVTTVEAAVAGVALTSQLHVDAVSAAIAASASRVLERTWNFGDRARAVLLIALHPFACWPSWASGLRQRSPAAWRANANGLVAVRSTAGSTVEKDSMSSLNLAVLLNCANGSPSSAGQFRIPVWNPR
jgi:hypothetical protein